MIGTTNAVVGKKVVSTVPVFTYTGNYTIIDEGEEGWQIQFLDSGTLNFTELDSLIDVWLVGGGGGSGGRDYGGGGGGGYTQYGGSISPVLGTNYSIVVGAGGVGTSTANSSGGKGGSSTAFGFTAEGGYGGQYNSGFYGGNGGSGGGAGRTTVGNGRGGSNGSNGYTDSETNTFAGTGQGKSTRDWGRYSGTLRSGGGGGGSRLTSPNVGGDGGGGDGGYGSASATGVAPTNGWDNYGGGAGGNATYKAVAANGGTGIVIIRNHRDDTQLLLFDSTKGGDMTANGWNLSYSDGVYYTSTVILSSSYINAHHKRADTASNNALLYTNDTIDFSNFASLHCLNYRGGGTTYQLPQLVVCTSDGTTAMSVTATSSTTETERMINVADLTGTYRVGVYQPGAVNISFDCDSYFTKIWLERQ